MTLAEWLSCALSDAERRTLPELKPVLEALARATARLREAEWNADASGQSVPPPTNGR